MNDPAKGARITCPSCSANNFAGKSGCWQCGAPLGTQTTTRPAGRSSAGPATSHHSPPLPSTQNDGFIRTWGMSKGVAALVVAAAVGAFLIVWFAAARVRSNDTGISSAHPISAPSAAPSDRSMPAERSATQDTDPIVDESKRFIERESRHAGLDPPPVASDGKVHLQNGGSISAEQYRDAQRRVNESPVIRTPIPAPPMP